MARHAAILCVCLLLGVGGEETFSVAPTRTARVLFEEDADNRALVCEGERCAFTTAGALAMATPLRAGVVRTRYEHDGMYGFDEEVVLVSGAGAVIGTLTQLEVDVTDGGSTLRMRRQRVVEVPGGPLLCVESVSECGPGLFTVMALGRRPYLPYARVRGVTAFVMEADGRLVQAPAMASRCPRAGYAPFAAPPVAAAEKVEQRRRVQGDARGTRGEVACR